ncbi:MAG: 2-amino-4-hydroxy-6-hydroxymethyldihydropteridine diphosphokinase [Acidobacteriaceae bacterium]
MKYTAYIGLGSNLASPAGNPTETVRAAIGALASLGSVTAQSSLYRTAPVGDREQPYFTNAVVCLETELEPEPLLGKLLEIERSFGRDRLHGIPKGPRTLDLDILLVFKCNAEPVVQQSPVLKLPHPGIAHRRFVLEPVAELDPGMLHPVLGKTMRQLLDGLSDGRANSEEEVTRL